MSRLLQLHAEKLVLFLLLGGVIAGIVSLAAHATIFPDRWSPPTAVDHAAPLRGHG